MKSATQPPVLDRALLDAHDLELLQLLVFQIGIERARVRVGINGVIMRRALRGAAVGLDVPIKIRAACT